MERTFLRLDARWQEEASLHRVHGGLPKRSLINL